MERKAIIQSIVSLELAKHGESLDLIDSGLLNEEIHQLITAYIEAGLVHVVNHPRLELTQYGQQCLESLYIARTADYAAAGE